MGHVSVKKETVTSLNNDTLGVEFDVQRSCEHDNIFMDPALVRRENIRAHTWHERVSNNIDPPVRKRWRKRSPDEATISTTEDRLFARFQEDHIARGWSRQQLRNTDIQRFRQLAKYFTRRVTFLALDLRDHRLAHA